ncbi:MAG: hypothetical protein ACK521_02340 [bacterium]
MVSRLRLEALENMLEQKERAVEASNQSIKDKYHLGNLNSGLYQQQADQLSQIKYRIDSLKKIKPQTTIADIVETLGLNKMSMEQLKATMVEGKAQPLHTDTDRAV